MENLELELEKNRQTEIVEPYKLPAGWKWCKQSEVCKLVDGEKIADKEYPYLEVKYLRGTKEKSFVTSGKLIKKGTKVILVDGENSGEVFAIHEDGYMGSTFKALSIENVDENYLQYFITTKKDLYRNNKKGSAIPHLNKDLFKNMPFPLPPTLAEQQRIVNRVETMFAKLDEAKEKAQNVVDSFETRKAAILHKAFTGELTANWRKENEVSLIIHESAFKDICTKITDGFHNSPKPVSKGYPYIMAGDIRENGIDFNNGLFMDEKNHRELYNKAHPENGDILVVNIGAGTGKSAIIDVDFEFSFKNCAILKLNKEIVNSKYVYLFFNLKKDYILKEITRGGAQPFLSLKMINELSITYPPLPEQQEIVRILDTVLEKESRAKESAQNVLDQIALLKKSILARAFRGEL